MFRAEARSKIEEELARGAQARREGLEGRARVCARRAAGAAIREYMALKDMPAPGPSAYDLMADMLEQPGLSAEMRPVIERLLARVDEHYNLPADVDLLEDARWLAAELEKQV